MPKLKKTSQKPIISFVISIMTGIIAFASLLFISSIILLKVNINREYLFLFLYVISAVSVFLSGFYFSHISINKRLVKGMLSAITVIVLIFITLTFFNTYTFTIKMLLILPIAFVFGFIGCIAGINLKRK